MNKEIIKESWMKYYYCAKRYYEEYGNLLIPRKYIVVEENGNVIHLGYWINTQRIAYKNKRLKEKQIELLNGIDMIWGVKYYKEKLALIERRFLQYQYGLLDEQNVNELIKEGVFEYKDSELTKGNAAVLTRNIPTKNVRWFGWQQLLNIIKYKYNFPVRKVTAYIKRKNVNYVIITKEHLCEVGWYRGLIVHPYK